MKIQLFAFCLAAAIVPALQPASVAADTVRSSANYGMKFDAIAAGSGAMSSASYGQPQTIIGQNVIWNRYVSANYDFQPTGVFRVPYPGSAARFWQLY